MSIKAARKHRAAIRNQKRAQENAAKRGDAEVNVGKHKTPTPDKAGIDWLLSKKRITPRQAKAGRRYGQDYRVAQNDGVVPLRSCINDNPGGGGGASVQPMAVVEAEARDRLEGARAAMSYQSDLIAVCDLICGRELTPWQVVGPEGSSRDVGRLEAVTNVALDLLIAHYGER